MILPVEPQAVERAIADYARTETEQEAQVRALSAQHHLLPLLVDWTGFIGLSSSGRLLWVEYDPPNAVSDAEATEASRWRAGIRHVTFAAGYRRYPELAWLEPVRTADCSSCPTCNGTGRPFIGDKPATESVVCECGGTGWLPPLAV